MSPKDESKELDRLLEIVSKLSSLDAKLESVKENIKNELSAIRISCDKCIADVTEKLNKLQEKHDKLEDKQEELEKKIIKGLIERTEWKAEFEKWKWRLGIITPILTVLITTAVIAILQRIFGPFF